MSVYPPSALARSMKCLFIEHLMWFWAPSSTPASYDSDGEEMVLTEIPACTDEQLLARLPSGGGFYDRLLALDIRLEMRRRAGKLTESEMSRRAGESTEQEIQADGFVGELLFRRAPVKDEPL